jgi:hypothetical protein
LLSSLFFLSFLESIAVELISISIYIAIEAKRTDGQYVTVPIALSIVIRPDPEVGLAKESSLGLCGLSRVNSEKNLKKI